MAPCMDESAFAGPARSGPARIQAIGRRHGEEAYIAAILGHQADRLDRLARDRTLIGDDDLAVRAGRPQPVGAVDDRLAVGRIELTDRLLERAGRQAEIDRAAGLVAKPGALVGGTLPVPLEVVEGPGHD